MQIAAKRISLLSILLAATGLTTAYASDTFTLSSPAVTGSGETGFDSGLVSVGRLDAAYAAKPKAEPQTRSFPIAWKGLPSGTKAIALILDDPDARLVLASYGMSAPAFMHWMVTDLDPSTGGLADNAALKIKAPQGLNGMGKPVYIGPQPPADIPATVKGKRIHIYRLTAYALSSPTGLKDRFSQGQLLTAIKDKTLGTTQLLISYSND